MNRYSYRTLPLLAAAAMACGLLLANSCSPSMTEPQPLGPEGVSMNAGDWSVSLGTTANHPEPAAGGGWALRIPGAGEGDVCYLTNPVMRSLPYGATVRASFDVIGGEDALEAVGVGNGDVPPAHLYLFMQQPLDNRTAELGRLWAAPTRLLLGRGQVMSAELVPGQWGATHAQHLDDDGFRKWIRTVGAVGVTFGGASSAGHCIYVGPVAQDSEGLTFVMREFSIR